jgi:uncharacterized protein (UPF0261 family)
LSAIAVIGTLDSKGQEHAFVADLIRQRGHETLMIDVGTGESPQIDIDISRHKVAACLDIDLDKITQRRDRGECVSLMSKAAPVMVSQLQHEGKIDGIISLGGGGGTAIGTSAMRALPLGFPKVMVSTLASGNTEHYVGTKDIVMVPSIVDIAGLNSISKMIFNLAAGAICGMVESKSEKGIEKPIIVASMFGNTTECINTAKEVLETSGYEVLIFHATGTGGKAMESLIQSGRVKGVLDVTTTEWADELTGATLSAGPTRLDAMSIANVPAVVSPGCLDMANFGEPESIPEKYKNRHFYVHNPQVTLMRTTAEECKKLGEIIATKCNANKAPTSIMLPLKGVSAISIAGQPFEDQMADKSLFEAIRSHAKGEVVEIEEIINSEIFARACAHKLLELIEINKKSQGEVS